MTREEFFRRGGLDFAFIPVVYFVNKLLAASLHMQTNPYSGSSRPETLIALGAATLGIYYIVFKKNDSVNMKILYAGIPGFLFMLFYLNWLTSKAILNFTFGLSVILAIQISFTTTILFLFFRWLGKKISEI